ncbi:helix-turn-helix domain-containing protein [Paracnuella aquatica]|uniref:helix-turn-helix domain-containing protein n=1 Tax=Paracnuella aquatica TaxID=2268757 RepID=UPI0012D772CB|nr:helix-turn-helix domain-containing protein [Paracnuella aquatica]
MSLPSKEIKAARYTSYSSKLANKEFMNVEVITKEDLQAFRMQLLEDIKSLLQQGRDTSLGHIEGYKTANVRKILGCSVNKLVSLRVARKIRTKKIGGTVYYNKEDVKRLVEEGF